MSRTRGSARSLQLVTLASIRQASNSCGEAVQETGPRVRNLTRGLFPKCLKPPANRGNFDRAMRAAAFLVLFPIVPLCAQASETALRDQYEQGEKALADKRYGDAEEAYNKLRQMAPRTAEVYAKLGLIYFQQGKYEQAVPVLRQGLKLKPDLANADTLLAMSLSELGQYHEAIPGLEKAFRRSTDVALKQIAGCNWRGPIRGCGRTAKRSKSHWN